MTWYLRKVKMVFIFGIFGVGIFAVQVLQQRRLAIYSFLNDQQQRQLAENQSLISNVMSQVISSEHIDEQLYLKLPKTFDSKCWNNPCATKIDSKWKMVFVVKSALRHGFAREILRRTWASVSYVEGYQFTTVFVVGKAATNEQQALIDEEYERYGDILQLNISDAYSSIARKTLGGMRWAFENFADDVFYTSCDDDFMINMAELVGVMQWHQNKTIQSQWSDFPIICSFKTRISDGPYRNNQSKYHVAREDYKWPYYPDYCLGGAYTTSVGVARQLWEASRGVKPLKMDDVWITGVLREKIGMPRQYIRKLDQSIATHQYGFHHVQGQSNREKMRDEWLRLMKDLTNVAKCYCSAT